MIKILFERSRDATFPVELSLAVTRVFVGATMAFAHGLGKVPPAEGFVGLVGKIGFPMPELFAWGAGISELVGGILLALGLATRPAAAAVMGTMVVAAFGAHGDDLFGKGELALLYAFATLPFLIKGGGTFSIDRFIKG
ncbi:MAG: DoxX family protein [Verrucomicrobiota bacterium]